MAPRQTAAKSKTERGKQPDSNRLSGWSSFAIRIWMRFERFAWDLGGVSLLAVSVMTLLALVVPELAEGKLLLWWSDFLRHWFGWGSLLVVMATGVLGLVMLRRRMENTPEVRWQRVFTLEIAAFIALTLMTLIGGGSLERAEAGLDGGVVGWGLAELIGILLPPVVSIALLSLLLVYFLVSGLGLGSWLVAQSKRFLVGETQPGIEDLSDPAVSMAPASHGEPRKGSASGSKQKPVIAPEYRKQFRIEPKEERPTSDFSRDEKLPPLGILVTEKDALPDERHINQRAGLIEQTLAEFGVPAKVIGFQVGPTVTQFAVEPGFIEKPGATDDEIARLRKVRVSQISGLARDLALALSAERLRVQAPVPGRPYVGIEVPNSRSAIVRLRPILEAETFYKEGGSPLAIALGRDVSGNPVVADLASMPHLLIAGTTGSGKSVCIAAFTTCLVMNNPPEDLRIVMIDPKMVELVRFNGLPHLFGKVETDLERILGVLRWVVNEMDRRYIILEQSRSRNIDSYNRKMRRRKDGQVLPRLVVMIDELADLMMSAPEATEHNLIRLAQMARAVGIHLVVATQRPSTDVVTGLIKANFPARMSFAVASSVDSRVILDTPGAEHLLGKGDMLFLPPEAGSPIRVQGVWVTDQEVEKAIKFWQKSYPVAAEETPPWDDMLEQEAILAERDELVENAIRLVARTQRASASMLQRQLRIGYPRAARLIEELEELGVVGPGRAGGRERDVLIDPDAEVEDVL